MCPTSYPRKGLCKAVNRSVSNNPVTTCLKLGYGVDYRIVFVILPEISIVVLQQQTQHKHVVAFLSC